MINIAEVKETNDMIEKENLDVRTITLGISLLNCIDDNLEKLNEKELTSLVLLLQGYSYHDISKILHKSYNQVYYQISLIKKKIMQEIKKNSTKLLAFSK